jgi:hypothetical protein
VLHSDYVATKMRELVPRIAIKQCTLAEGLLSPVGGAALLALGLARVTASPDVVERLQRACAPRSSHATDP